MPDPKARQVQQGGFTSMLDEGAGCLGGEK